MITKTQPKRPTLLPIVRILIQLIFLIFLPGFYIGALNGIKAVYLAVIEHNITAALLPQLIEVAATIPVTMLLGRFFCGWMCAFGAFSDFVTLLAQKFFDIKPRKLSRQADSLMKILKYVILAALIAVVWSLDLQLSAASPWNAFGMLVTVGKMPDFSYVLSHITIGFAILVIILIASAFIERFFCRYFCPMGAVFALASKARVVKIHKPTSQCGNCRACTNHCAMGISLYEMEEVSSGECINCMKCVNVCPRGNAVFSADKKAIRPLAACAVALAVITGVYAVGNQMDGVSSSGTSNTSQTASAASASQLYKDGTYEGSGSGFHGGTTTVSVTIENGSITDIQTVSYGDDKPFYSKAYSSITQDIINSQSTDVDTVSGATFSSNGIKQAVADALSKASSR